MDGEGVVWFIAVGWVILSWIMKAVKGTVRQQGQLGKVEDKPDAHDLREQRERLRMERARQRQLRASNPSTPAGALTDLRREKLFREDLFYRLNVIPVEMPALRERLDDIPLIAEHFLAKYTREMDKAIDAFSPEVLAALRAYTWPGNVRELENMVERAVALESGRIIQFATLPENLREGRPATSRSGDQPDAAGETGDGFSLERHLQHIERSHLERALEREGGVQTKAAATLGLSFRQFRYLMRKHGLKRE